MSCKAAILVLFNFSSARKGEEAAAARDLRCQLVDILVNVAPTSESLQQQANRRVRREWSSGLSAGLWVGRPGFESWPGHYVVALSKPLHSPCFVFSDKTLSRRSRLLQGLG